MRRSFFVLFVLVCLLDASVFAHQLVPSASGIGVANVIVSNIFWGSNPAVPSAAHPGDVNDQLSIVLTNVGDDVARSVTATLPLGPPLAFSYYVNGTQIRSNTISKVAGDINPGMSFTLGYTVNIDSNAKEGIYRYNLEISYSSARELQQIDTNALIYVPIWKGELHIQGLVTLPTKIYPGNTEVVLKVGIVNTGIGAANNVQLQLELTPPFTASSSGSDKIYVGNIAPNQVAEADFIVDVADGAQFGQYSLVLGEQAGSSLVPIGQLSVFINEKVRFEIANVTPDTVSAGDSGVVVEVALKNVGSVKADSVRVQLRVGNFFTGTLTDFLGTMLAGETKVAFFTVDIDSKAQPGPYNLDLQLDWTQDNNALSDTQTLTLNVVNPSPPVTLIAVGIVVVAVVAGYAIFRRRRMRAAQTSSK